MKKFLFLLLILISYTASAQMNLFREGVFLHHSTGNNIWGPNGSSTSVPDEIGKYNQRNGFDGPLVCRLDKEGWPVNPWNNEWYRWSMIFEDRDPTADISSFIFDYKIIMIKSCYPSSAMAGWGMTSDTLTPEKKTVRNYKWHWRRMIEVMARYDDNFFVIWTNAPLVEGATNDSQALLSHHFCKWAKDTLAEGLDPLVGEFPANIYIFDFFHKLAGTDHKLQLQYAKSNTDSHPNAAATELVAPQLVEEIFDAALDYEATFPQLPPPTPVYPKRNANRIPVDTIFRWNHSGGDSYTIEVATDTYFNNVVFSDFVIGDTSLRVHGLDHERVYHWHVRAALGKWRSGWSSNFIFTTIKANPDIPEKISPENYEKQVPLLASFKWLMTKPAASYRLQVSPDELFNDILVDEYVYDTLYTLEDPLQRDMEYFWRLQSINDAEVSDWSNPWRFYTVMSETSPPELLEPADGALSFDPNSRLVWSKPEFSQEFAVQVSTSEDFSDLLINIQSYQDSVYQLFGNVLANKDVYWWRVKAKNLSGESGWSTVKWFSTLVKPPAPDLLDPANGDTVYASEQPIFRWRNSIDCQRYYYNFSYDEDFEENILDYFEHDTTYRLTQQLFEDDSKVYWRIRGWNDAAWGDWSETRYFINKIVSSVDGNNQYGGLAITPNPAWDRISIMLTEDIYSSVDIRIYNIRGNLLIRRLYPPGNTANDLNISRLAPGIYILKAVSAGEIYTAPLMIIR